MGGKGLMFIQAWYCKGKLDASHSWGLKGQTWFSYDRPSRPDLPSVEVPRNLSIPYLIIQIILFVCLYQDCLAAGKLETAASYLIILQNLEQPAVSKQVRKRMWTLTIFTEPKKASQTIFRSWNSVTNLFLVFCSSMKNTKLHQLIIPAILCWKTCAIWIVSFCCFHCYEDVKNTESWFYVVSACHYLTG